jgi:hypothetical protein
LQKYLIFVEFLIGKFVLPLFLECYDDQGNEDVDEEKREHDEIYDVEDGHLHSVPGLWTMIFSGGVDGMFQNPMGQSTSLLMALLHTEENNS